jgi:hypothetical protein
MRTLDVGFKAHLTVQYGSPCARSSTVKTLATFAKTFLSVFAFAGSTD